MIPASICWCSPSIAGAADPALRQWDVVLADAVVQHDMDARPLFPRFTLPALKKDRLQPQPAWFNWAKTALLEAHSAGDLDGFAQPSSGLIATGDRFIGDPAVLQALRDALPELRAVEMEGAAVAQVAEQEGIPWLVVRVISDGADEAAAQSFEDFVKRYENRPGGSLRHCCSAATTRPDTALDASAEPIAALWPGGVH